MKKDPDHNSIDHAEIEALITRLKRGQLREEDTQLLNRLLRLLIRLIVRFRCAGTHCCTGAAHRKLTQIHRKCPSDLQVPEFPTNYF